MRTQRVWTGATLVIAFLLADPGLRGQEVRRLPPASMPPVVRHAVDDRALLDAPDPLVSKNSDSLSSYPLHLEADFLLVHPRRRPHDFAIALPDARFLVGDVKSFDWDTAGAIRVGASYQLGGDLEVGGAYTYLHSKDDQTVVRPTPAGGLLPTLSVPFPELAGSAVGSSNLDLDVIDLELARRLPLGDLDLRLGGGGRAAAIQQKSGVAYDFGSIPGNALGTANVSNRMQFDGLGIRVGGQGEWKVGGSGLILWSKAAASMMAGDFKTSVNQTVNSGRTPLVDVSEKFTKLVPVTELGLGVAWKMETVKLSVGYELSSFFNVVDVIDFGGATGFRPNYRAGDLSLEALTVSLGLSY